MSFRNLSIKTKLLAGFGILALVVLVVSGLSLHALNRAIAGFDDYIHGLNARGEMATLVRTAVDRRAIAARNLVLVKTPEDVALEKAEVLRAHDDVARYLGKLNDMIAHSDASQEARTLVAEVNQVEAKYGPVATAIVNLALASQHDAATAKMNAECRPLLAALVKATDAYASFTRERQQEMVQRLQDDYQTQRNLLIVVSIAAVAFGLIGGLLLTRAITGPIQRAVELARTVARGEANIP